MIRWLLALALACCCVSHCFAACPPQGFDSMVDLDVKKFLQGTWYSQQQAVTRNLKADMMNCVKVEYKPKDASDLNQGIQVLQYANKGSVNGPAVDTDVSTYTDDTFNLAGLLAFPSPLQPGDSTAAAASKLQMGPSLLEAAYKSGMKRVFANHWVVAAGPSADPALGYDWAIVTAGAPKHHTQTDKCRTGDAFGNYQGVWLYSRKPMDADSTAKMRAVAEKMGLDISNLKAVTQEGCTYKPIPADPLASGQGNKESLADALKEALAASGPEEDTTKEQPTSQESHMRTGLFGLLKHATAGGASASVASGKAPATVSVASATPAQAPVANTDPLAITHKAEFNVTTGGVLVGKVVLGLFGNIAPQTVQNFVSICRGNKGFNYKGSQFHRVIKDFMIQGGDFERNDGTGGFSIFGETFPDEKMGLRLQLSRGVVAMANAGPDTNGSQFFITVVQADWLNGKHVVFGRVMKGMDIVDDISDMAVDPATDKPLTPVVISGCKAWKEQPKTA